MKYVFFLLSITFSLTLNAQINAGVKDSVFSKILNEQRQLMIYFPKEVQERKDSTKRYPVMYVLDGNTHFLSVAGMIDQLSDQGGNAVLPKMIRGSLQCGNFACAPTNAANAPP
jgi:predicted alpha/beta superfamily hydrolase